MLKVRVIPCLLLSNGGLVKTVRFKNPTYIGDPINAVKIYNDKQVDELIFLDIDVSRKGREPNFALIKDLATECFMPFAYGGGIKNIEQIKKILGLGVEKIVINSSALQDLSFVKEACLQFGSSTILGAMDVKKTLFGGFKVYNHVKKSADRHDPMEYALKLQEAGIGELFINFVDRDGTYEGYDVIAIEKIAGQMNIPVIACGGAGNLKDIETLVKSTHVSAAAAGSMFVYKGPHRAVLISYPSQEELVKSLT